MQMLLSLQVLACHPETSWSLFQRCTCTCLVMISWRISRTCEHPCSSIPTPKPHIPPKTNPPPPFPALVTHTHTCTWPPFPKASHPTHSGVHDGHISAQPDPTWGMPWRWWKKVPCVRMREWVMASLTSAMILVRCTCVYTTCRRRHVHDSAGSAISKG